MDLLFRKQLEDRAKEAEEFYKSDDDYTCANNNGKCSTTKILPEIDDLKESNENHDVEHTEILENHVAERSLQGNYFILI